MKQIDSFVELIQTIRTMATKPQMINGTVFWMEANIQHVSLNEQGDMEFQFEPLFPTEQNQTTTSETQALVLTVATTGPNASTSYGYCIIGRVYDKFEHTHHTSTTTNLSELSGYKIIEITSYDGEPSLPDENMYHWPTKEVCPIPQQNHDDWISRHDYLVRLIRSGSIDLTIYIQTVTKSRSLFEYGRLDHQVKSVTTR
jgi:hypothetical protein